MGEDGSSSRRNKKSYDSFLENLKVEWNLFWHSIVGDEDDQIASNSEQDIFENKLQNMSLEQIRSITKSLSQDRKLINQRIEVLHKEIELNQAKLDGLKAIGQEFSIEDRRLTELHDLGQNLTQQLSKLDVFLKLARKREAEIKKELKSQLA